MRQAPEVRFDVPTRDVLDELASEPLPLDLRATPLVRSFHRDIYFDTSDRTLESRGVSCRLRFQSDDRRIFSIDVRNTNPAKSVERVVYRAEVPELGAEEAFRGASEPARRLRGFVAPERLGPIVEWECERRARRAGAGWLPLWPFEVVYDDVTVRGVDGPQSFQEMKIRHRRRSGDLDAFVRALQHGYPIRTTLTGKVARAQKRLAAVESRSLARAVQESRELAVIATFQGKIALRREGNTLLLPVDRGSGEDACRLLLREHVGTIEAKLRLLGTAAAAGARPVLEVWIADDLPDAVEERGGDAVQWFTLGEIMSRVGSPLLRDARTLAALAVAGRSDLLPTTFERPVQGDGLEVSIVDSAQPDPATLSIADLPLHDLPAELLDTAQPVPEQFINEELSWIEFNARVLEMAEDPDTPLLARFRFLAIFSSNLDEFVMVRVGALKGAVARGIRKTSIDGLTPQEQLDAISIRLSPLVRRQQRCFRALLPELARHGVRVCAWNELDEGQRAAMRTYFDEKIFPALTPQAVTQAPGHPFPHIPNLRVSLAAMIRDLESGSTHFANIRIPSGLPRFISLPGGEDLIAIEEVVGGNLGTLYPGHEIVDVRPFRITRSGDIEVDEEGAANLLQAIEEEVKRRPFGGVVRIESARGMPNEMLALLEKELQFESSGQVSTLSETDIFEIDGLIDLTAVHELASLPLRGLDYPGLVGAAPLDPNRSIFDQIAERDILVYHPYDSFESTVERFIVEAAGDPDVIAIKLTMYRSGSQSTIVDALMRAAAGGKEVAVFVELKARFDEERNIQWARKLERAGIHVVYGLVRLKTHAKTTLVVRIEGDLPRRYVHVGTGNYNAATSKFYTDLGLLTCRRKIGADLNDLFNEFTGSSRVPRTKFQRLLVAPRRMRKRFLRLIEREVIHAREGRGGRIRLKFNGLADREMIGALYWASQEGVEIDLVVRGICALRPGVPNLSDRIRVVSVLGRLLEHARIYHFANGGEPEYYIGSADWRPRNLRRRVEVVAPVTDPDACAKLDRILELELGDPLAWQMNSDGSYARRPAPTGVDQKTAQEYWIAQLEVPQQQP